MLKTIVISLTIFIGKYCLCIGNAADILFSHRCNHQRRTRGRGLIRHSLRQTLPVFKDVYRKTGIQQAILRTCSRKNVIFLSHSLVIDNKRGARMNKTLIAATVAGIVLLASNAQAQTVPEGYQLQQVLMMSRHNLRAAGEQWQCAGAVDAE